MPAPLGSDRPHVLVDGAPRPKSILCLSHWRSAPIAKGCEADTSTGIVLAWLARHQRLPAPVVVTDHLDQDGLVGTWALLNPAKAEGMSTLLEQIASAGDFAVFSDLAAARVSFALAALADPERSPLDPGLFTATPRAQEALGLALLGWLPELASGGGESLWREEEAWYSESAAMLDEGVATVREIPAVGLAIVSAPPSPSRLATRFFDRVDLPIHPAAIHNSTDASAVLIHSGPRHHFYFRYETWVRFVSRPLPPRVDLGPLAARLTDEETSGARWSFDGVNALVATLGHDVPSGLGATRVGELVAGALGGQNWAPRRKCS